MIVVDINGQKFGLEDPQKAESLLAILIHAKPLKSTFVPVDGQLSEVIHEQQEANFPGLGISLSPSRIVMSFEQLQRLKDDAGNDEEKSQAEKSDFLPPPPASADITA